MSSLEHSRGRPRRGRPPRNAARPDIAGLDFEEAQAILEQRAAEAGSPGGARESREGSRDDDESNAPADGKVLEDRMLEKIRGRLAAVRGVDASGVHVSIERGVVILSGSAVSDAARQSITNSVSASAGVKVIRNRIRLGARPSTVKPTQKKP